MNMFKALFHGRSRYVAIMAIIMCFGATVYIFTRLSVNTWKMKIESFFPTDVFHNDTRSLKIHLIPDMSLDATHRGLILDVNITALKYKVRQREGCQDVVANPRSYWRSQTLYGSLNTSESDIKRMGLAFSCGILLQDYLSKPPISSLYPLEKFYLSEPPLVNIASISNENVSVITSYNSSLQFKVGETVTFKIDMKNSSGHPKQKGGDQIRVWFVEGSTKSFMAAKVLDLNNGTYIASAPLLWAGKLRVNVALAYPREYIRALLYAHQVIKAFRHIAAVFERDAISEATPCYHTPVVPGFDSSELCNLTDVNGAPWFCGRPLKRQLNCSDYTGTVVIRESQTYPLTDAETEIFKRSCNTPKISKSMFLASEMRLSNSLLDTGEPRIRRIPNSFELIVSPGNSSTKIPCNKVLPQSTWTQEIPTGHISHNNWYPRFCTATKPDYTKCFQNKQILIFGDSNGRSHYYNILAHSKCTEIKKALKKSWHKPLLCVHKGNNFTMTWNPHTNPFMNGASLASLDSLIATSNALDAIPSHGYYFIILNHFYHLTVSHISAFDFLCRNIKDALVRLFKRNPNVQVVLQGPHIAWFGWPEHYAAGDMLGASFMDLQQEIFQDIKDKVVYISPWDMTIATANWDYHPSTNKQISQLIDAFMCGR